MVKDWISFVLGTGGKTTERTEKKELHIENTNDRETNWSRATEPPTAESPEDNEQQSGLY